MLLKRSQLIALLLIAGLIMPLCMKAFAGHAAASDGVQTVEASEPNGSKKQSLLPCLSCCGGWKALVRDEEVALFPPQKIDAKLKPGLCVATHPLAPVKEVQARAPPDVIISPFRYAEVYARTGRLLL
ncbi:MAG: hypothetical protein ACR2OR_14250 [Hyphomicrobiales bacterium]